LEEAKIFGRERSEGSITLYQKAVNEAAGKLALKEPGLLAHKGSY
jgi:hypothetical protein